MASLEIEYRESTFVIKTSFAILEFSNEPLNKKLCLIFFRLLKDPITEKSIYTYKEIADAFG